MIFRLLTIISLLHVAFFLVAQPTVLQQPARAQEQFEQGEALYLQGNYKAAVPYFAKAEKSYGSNYDGKLMANALHSLSLLQSGKKEAAYYAFYQVGEAIADSQKVSAAAKATLDYCISRYHWSYNEKQEALALLPKVKIEVAKPNALPIALSVEINQYLGEVEHNKGNYEEALQYYLAAIAAANQLPVDKRNQKTFAEDNLIIGELQEQLIDPDSAIQVYRNILANKATIIPDDIEKEIELSFRLGKIYFEQQQYELALPYLQNALFGIQKSQQNRGSEPSIKAMIATIYLDKRNYKQAAIFNTPALGTWNTKLSTGELENAFKSYLNQGLIYRKIEAKEGGTTWYAPTVTDTEQDWQTTLSKMNVQPVEPILTPSKKVDLNLGLINYEKAAGLIKKFPNKQQKIKEIEIAMAKGALFYEADDFVRAKQFYQRALDLMEPIYPEKHPLVAEASRMLGDCLVAQKQFALALGFMDKAINASMKAGSEISSDGVPNPDDTAFPFELLNAISSKGVALSGLNSKKTKDELLKILANYQAAIKLLHTLRKTHRNEGSKYRLSAAAHKLCQQAVLTANSLWELTKDKQYLEVVFNYAELSKSATLLESIRDLKARKINGVPSEVTAQENDLKVSIAYLSSEIFYELKQGSNKDEKRLAELEKEKEEKLQQHEQMLQSIEEKYPAYYAMKYNYTAPKLEQLQAALQPNEVFLEYVAADGFVYLLAVSKDEIYTQYHSTEIPLAAIVTQLQQAIQQNKFKQYFRLGYDLYSLVWSSELDGFLNGKKLIVSADAELSYLPFGVLPTRFVQTDNFTQKNYTDPSFLIQKYAISYSYSASLFLLSTHQKVSTGKKKLVAWAPNFAAVNASISAKMKIEDLIELPGAIEEATSIAQLFDGQVWAKEKATELAFKEQSPNYDVIHIATHGILNDEDPLFSSLVLVPEGDEDGILHTHELFNMQLNAELAVLSACNSGSGKLTRGEGVISIARGFAYAGVPNIVMTKWQVSDFTTKIIMGNFYRNLQKGMHKDEAMQQAKLLFMKTYLDKPKVLAPFYWGAFVVMGNNSPVAALTQSTTNWYPIVGGIVFVLLLLTIGLIVWKRRKQ